MEPDSLTKPMVSADCPFHPGTPYNAWFHLWVTPTVLMLFLIPRPQQPQHHMHHPWNYRSWLASTQRQHWYVLMVPTLSRMVSLSQGKSLQHALTMPWPFQLAWLNLNSLISPCFKHPLINSLEIQMISRWQRIWVERNSLDASLAHAQSYSVYNSIEYEHLTLPSTQWCAVQESKQCRAFNKNKIYCGAIGCNCNTRLLQWLHMCNFMGSCNQRNLPMWIRDE